MKKELFLYLYVWESITNKMSNNIYDFMLSFYTSPCGGIRLRSSYSISSSEQFMCDISAESGFVLTHFWITLRCLQQFGVHQESAPMENTHLRKEV